MMQGADALPDDYLPRSVAGRGLLLVLSIGAIAFAGTFLMVLALGRGDGTWAHWGFRVASGEFCSALLATGLAGLVWAIATPPWLPNLAVRIVTRMAICLLIPWVLILAVVLWPW